MGNGYGKMILMLGWSGLVFYDEDDNFRDKDWILTSYDNSRKEDKIRNETENNIVIELTNGTKFDY